MDTEPPELEEGRVMTVLMGDPPRELWNTTEVARFLGIKATSVSAYRHRGQMPPPLMTVGKQTHLWDAATIRAWQARRSVNADDRSAGQEATPPTGTR